MQWVDSRLPYILVSHYNIFLCCSVDALSEIFHTIPRETQTYWQHVSYGTQVSPWLLPSVHHSIDLGCDRTRDQENKAEPTNVPTTDEDSTSRDDTASECSDSTMDVEDDHLSDADWDIWSLMGMSDEEEESLDE